MDIEDFNRGDKVVIDMERLREMMTINPHLDSIEKFKGEVEGFDETGKLKIVGMAEENGLDKKTNPIQGEIEGKVPPETIATRYEICPQCDEVKSYHDRKEEWICLSCERGKLE